MDETHSNPRIAELEGRLARMEERLGKVELVLGMQEPVEQRKSAAKPARDKAELELAVGQHLFSKVGILVLAIGGMLTLSLPWAGLASYLPSLAGLGAALALFATARLLQKRAPMDARYFRISAMALLFFAALRMCHFVESPCFGPQSAAAALTLAVAVAINLAVACWRKSIFLTGMGLVTGFIAALAVGTPYYTLGMISVMLIWGFWLSHRQGWKVLPMLVIPLAWLSYLIWAIGNPVIGNPIHVVDGPMVAVFVLLGWMLLIALMTALRRNRSDDGMELQVATLFNCGGYMLFLLHSLLAFRESFAVANIVASVVLLALAVFYWLREKCHFATFLYAMTGYGALTAALISLSGIPQLFVWLSAQSLLVVVTAIWFRSRFIIVANFLIYLAVITSYMLLVDHESGISLIFVWVALTSSRILKVHMAKLELKTELMRNAYLASAFIVFPYALYHIVPPSWVAASWVGIALFYYLMNLLTKARKYRWMGHNTLLLTVGYIIIRSIGSMQGTQRVVSFLLLGTVLLVVSLVFTVMRSKQSVARDGDKSE